MDKRFVGFVLTLILIAALSWALILYARGYRFIGGGTGPTTPQLEKTGMLMVKSYPDGAKLLVDGKLEGPTNTSVSNLSPGTHSIKIIRDGYFEYQKQVEVLEELVTVVEALLIPLSPALSPLTYNGVADISQSPSKDMVIYSSVGNGEPGGVWKLPLTGRPNLLVSDTSGITFSKAEEFHWSPNESELLVKVGSQYYLLSLNLPNLNPQPVVAETILNAWDLSTREREEVRIEKLDLAPRLRRVATDSGTIWSPDREKFLYQAYDPELAHYQKHTYSLIKPRPVGSKDDYITLEYKEGEDIDAFWYGDSAHLVVVEAGQIYLVELDGSNKTLIYSGNFDPRYVFARPGGGGIIILTKFNDDAPSNFYLVGV